MIELLFTMRSFLHENLEEKLSLKNNKNENGDSLSHDKETFNSEVYEHLHTSQNAAFTCWKIYRYKKITFNCVTCWVRRFINDITL